MSNNSRLMSYSRNLSFDILSSDDFIDAPVNIVNAQFFVNTKFRMPVSMEAASRDHLLLQR